MSRPPLLAFSLGDAAGIGPEIALRLLQEPPPEARLLIIGCEAALARELASVPDAPLPPSVAHPEDVSDDPGAVAHWRGSAPLTSLPAYGSISAEAGAASHAWVLQAADLALRGDVAGIVTGPIHKAAWHAAGVTHPGHTEALCEHAGAERVLMMLIGERLRVALATTHVALRAVPDLLDPARLMADLLLLAQETARSFGPDRPRIAVCGLNPHAGEEGLFGTEDADVIAPAVAAARARGVDAHGPLPADGCIPAAVAGHYDAVFAMYHDQALPAVKSVAQRRGVNITLGLPFVRTSVDHGTAFDRAGRGQATAASLRAAIRTAAAVVEHRENSTRGAQLRDEHAQSYASPLRPNLMRLTRFGKGMARKATDLLDVFRFSDDGDDDSHRDSGRAASKARKPKKKKAAKTRQRVQGLILNRRQIVLGSSAIALLLVLSFVLGLSTGRSGPTTQPTKIERRAATRYAIRGSLPVLDSATQKAIEPKTVAAILKRDYGLDSDHLRLSRSEGRLLIDVGPFRTERAAREWLEKSNLEMLHLFMEDPFRWAEYVAW